MYFFRAQDLIFFQSRLKTNNKYIKDQLEDVQVGQKLKEVVFIPTNEWASLVAKRLSKFKFEEDNIWNVSGYFKKYSWARLLWKHEGDRGIYFTLGVDGPSATLILKIDYKHTGDSLTEVQKIDIKSYIAKHVQPTVIEAHELSNYNWDKLVDQTLVYINSNIKHFGNLHRYLDDPKSITQNNDTNPKRVLNCILYGPPGTGKTYETIDLAVEIADGPNENDHPTNKKRFDQLRKDGQIEFITFHQNYTYEDFVIGLKPDVESGSLKFEQREGIFYQIADRARQNYKASQSENSMKTFNDVYGDFINPLLEDEEIPVKMTSGKTFSVFDISENNIYFRKASGTKDHTLSKNTLKQLYEGSAGMPTGGMKTYYKPLVDLLIQMGKGNNHPIVLNNYVLIIDEINRANMSRVFGELITLLEDDKRLGGDNELTVTLSSGELFSVPPNLYLIGTMNTADKSLALLDIALRRRFEFIGKYPNYSLLIEPARGILERLNKAILMHKKSADFQIGHAYFINKSAEQLKSIMDNRVIPLLLEYFNGRADMVEKILVEAQIPFIKNELTLQFEAQHEAL